MTDYDQPRYHYFFINNVIGSFFKGALDYFTDLYDRYEYTVVGTYDKGVEYIRQKEGELGREVDLPNLPALILDPGDFEIDDSNSGGAKQLWRFPNLAPGLITRLNDPIYEDGSLIITPGFTRIKGEMELILLLNSFYEYCDMRIYMSQIFGGTGRYIYPFTFNSFIILDDDVLNYSYENEYTGSSYTIDWDANGAVDQLIPNINQTKKAYPVSISPNCRITGMSDASEKYGATDNLAEWKLSINIAYEIELPTFLVAQSDYMMDSIKLNFKFGSAYSVNSSGDANDPNRPPERIATFISSWNTGLVEGVGDSEFVLPTDQTSYTETILTYKRRYYHQVTSEEASATTNVEITIPESITSHDNLILFSNGGTLSYGDHWKLTSPTTLELQTADENIALSENMIIELYIYE